MTRMWFQTLFLRANAGEGGGGGGAAGGGSGGGEGTEGGGAGFDPMRAAGSMMREARGNVKSVIAHLIREGRRYRERIRAQDEELKTRPPALKEGEAILTAEQNKKWQVLSGIKLEPEKVVERVTKADELETKEQQRTREKKIADAAMAAKYKRPGLLVSELGHRGQEIVEREVDVQDAEGKRSKVKANFVRKVGAADTDPATPLEDYVDTELKDYKELLMTEPNESRLAEDSSQGGERNIPAQVGVRGRAPKSDAVSQHVASRGYASPNEIQNKQAKQGA